MVINNEIYFYDNCSRSIVRVVFISRKDGNPQNIDYQYGKYLPCVLKVFGYVFVSCL
jgi:hypothetical protein